ncbi:hypothetical protein L1887_53351 [Cichorium endivia]|nr:hypothetical protein L1887_53351 [Cichorium endivia]
MPSPVCVARQDAGDSCDDRARTVQIKKRCTNTFGVRSSEGVNAIKRSPRLRQRRFGTGRHRGRQVAAVAWRLGRLAKRAPSGAV